MSSERVNIAKCTGCARVHQIPVGVEPPISQMASPCCGKRLKKLSLPREGETR